MSSFNDPKPFEPVKQCNRQLQHFGEDGLTLKKALNLCNKLKFYGWKKIEYEEENPLPKMPDGDASESWKLAAVEHKATYIVTAKRYYCLCCPVVELD